MSINFAQNLDCKKKGRKHLPSSCYLYSISILVIRRLMNASERFRIDEDALDLPSCIGNGARKDVADLSRKIHITDVFGAVCPEPESALRLSALFDVDHMRFDARPVVGSNVH